MLVINYYCLFKILNSCLKPEKKRLDDNRECGNCKEAKKKGKKKKANTLGFRSSSNIRQKAVVEGTFICQISSAVECLPANKYVQVLPTMISEMALLVAVRLLNVGATSFHFKIYKSVAIM